MKSLHVRRDEGYSCVELMCWPPSKAERRYAGVTHMDVTDFGAGAGRRSARHSMADAGVAISGLGYYPNPLTPDREEADVYVEHISEGDRRRRAARAVGAVNTFIGRDWTKSVDDNWPRFLRSLEAAGPVRRGPRRADRHRELPDAVHARRMARRQEPGHIAGRSGGGCSRTFPATNFGLNYDPSHMVWQQMDYLKPLREFADRLFHVHAKDVRVDRHRFNDVGILAHPLRVSHPEAARHGRRQLGPVLLGLDATSVIAGRSASRSKTAPTRDSLEARKASLRQSHTYLRNFVADRT